MKDYKNFLAEAAKRDHRVIGRNQELFLFHPLSPGSCFFLPHGTRIYNTLVEFMRDQFWKRYATASNPHPQKPEDKPTAATSTLKVSDRWHGRLVHCERNVEKPDRGYTEVSSPNVFDFQLWETSGHAKNYRENMFTFEVEHRDFGLKPMNCPGHCLIYGARTRSYRELPLRMAEFGILHRNELSGTLKGLTRVRKFVQDDAHIFCTHEQVAHTPHVLVDDGPVRSFREFDVLSFCPALSSWPLNLAGGVSLFFSFPLCVKVGAEMVSYLEFMSFVYGIFGFSFKLELSTRPEKYMGEIEQWDLAEKELAAALKTFTVSPTPIPPPPLSPLSTSSLREELPLSRAMPCINACIYLSFPEARVWFGLMQGKECGDGWELNPGDGAFYGPKIDIKVFDALNRAHQCATVQLDFQLPSANVFDLSYRAGAPESAAPLQRPVIIHRAIYGSIERFFAIITEHYAGKWPLWLSPRQVVVVPVSEKYLNYAHKVESTLMQGKFYVDVDASDHKLAKKVREAQLAQYNFILVVGEKEEADGTVNVRTRENTVQGEKTVEAFKEELEELRRNFK